MTFTNAEYVAMTGKELLSFTPEQFEKMCVKEQSSLLRALDNFASNCSGKTAAIADAKRKPYIKLENEFRKIKEAQTLAWINAAEDKRLKQIAEFA